MVFYIFLLIFALLIVWITVTYFRALKIKGNLPGPTIYPLLLNDYQVIQFGKKPFIEDYYSKYGDTFIIVSNFFVSICTVDVNNVQYFISENHNFKNYKRTLRSGMVYEIGSALFGDGILFTDGIVWEVQRLHTNPMFKVEKIINMVPTFERKSKQTIEKLNSLNLKEPIDMQEIFMRYTLDSFFEIGFGLSLDRITKNAEFPRWFDQAQQLIIDLIRNPITRLLKQDEYKNIVSSLDKVVYDIIDQKKKTLNENNQDLISQFMSLRDADGKPYPDKWIRDIILNFMIAGRDTTATLLTWTTYLLSSNPQILKELVNEISHLNGKTLTYDNITELKYLDNVIKESLRLYAPVPSVGRYAEKDDKLPDGTPVPAGTRINYHPFYLNRHPKYWDKPGVYNPERWNNPSVVKHSYQYLPFHGGPMSCIGRKLAVVEAKCMIILLLQNFGIESLPHYNYKPAFGILNNCVGGCPIILSKK